MSAAPIIARREFFSYFYSPSAYVSMALFLLISGLIFSEDFQPGQSAEMRHLMERMVWLLVVIVPVLGMGLLAQEFNSGTIETLTTAPVTEMEIVFGKFAGLLAFFLVLIAPTLLFVIMLRMYGQPDPGPVLSGYLGIVLVGALFIAVTLFCSSLSRIQLVAAALAVVILSLITLVPYYAASQATLPPFWRSVVDHLVFRRYTDFSRGMIDTSNIVFFIVTTGLFLFLTVKAVESRRWR